MQPKIYEKEYENEKPILDEKESDIDYDDVMLHDKPYIFEPI